MSGVAPPPSFTDLPQASSVATPSPLSAKTRLDQFILLINEVVYGSLCLGLSTVKNTIAIVTFYPLYAKSIQGVGSRAARYGELFIKVIASVFLYISRLLICLYSLADPKRGSIAYEVVNECTLRMGSIANPLFKAKSKTVKQPAVSKAPASKKLSRLHYLSGVGLSLVLTVPAQIILLAIIVTGHPFWGRSYESVAPTLGKKFIIYGGVILTFIFMPIISLLGLLGSLYGLIDPARMNLLACGIEGKLTAALEK